MHVLSKKIRFMVEFSFISCCLSSSRFTSFSSWPCRRSQFFRRAQGCINFFDRRNRGGMLSGFDAVKGLDTNSGSPRQFGLRPTNAFTIAHNITSQYCPHRRHGRPLACRISRWQCCQLPIVGFRQNHESLAIQYQCLNVCGVNHHKTRLDVLCVRRSPCGFPLGIERDNLPSATDSARLTCQTKVWRR